MKQPFRVTGEGFERMAESVAEIEQSAGAGQFELVFLDDLGLGADAGGDGVQPVVPIAGENRLPMGFEPGEEGRVAKQPVFHHFGITGPELARRQRAQHRCIGKHEARLMKGADQVLALFGVDAGLAADRGIHLRQKCRGDLHEANATAEHARGEAGEIADHAATESHDAIAALDANFEQALGKTGEHGKALARFARVRRWPGRYRSSRVLGYWRAAQDRVRRHWHRSPQRNARRARRPRSLARPSRSDARRRRSGSSAL